ncbi:MAG: 2-polyprenyl-3-methyl-6-methoxy-1,4-benzoquinone monooxygenase [Gammaproteobacteria bacterium]|nr:2-polyprenyl-3-methyl-6-methoxy-1,4-benzoquinone monooxygenase [Gammaproteobacteria bacterium]
MHSLLDRCLEELDTALRVVTTRARTAPADLPGHQDAMAEEAGTRLSTAERAESARLMRVNHSGEIAAQALYRGQAFVTRDQQLRVKFHSAANEEHSHLLWCDHRVRELGHRASRLGVLWYSGSFIIGALAGLAGDRISLGFLAETEKQVTEHLERHLSLLPENDQQSHRIVRQMRDDEQTHKDAAIREGGTELPDTAKRAMQGAASIMTGISYWI